MIYQLNDDYIDLKKVEMITNIKEDIDFDDLKPNGFFYYDFQVNGISYKSDKLKDKKSVEIERENLLNAWREYKEERL